MRVTDRSVSEKILANITQSRERLADLQNQLSSNKRIQRMSDDPQGAELLMRLKTLKSKNTQYQKNISSADGMMNTADAAFTQFNDLLTDFKSLTSEAINQTTTETTEQYITRLNQLISRGVNIANTKFNDRYVFGGTQTQSAPFVMAADYSTVTTNPNGITGDINVPVADRVMQKTNIDGDDAFGGTQVFDLMIKMRDDLKNGVLPDQTSLDAISTFQTQVLGQQAQLGLMHQNLKVSQSLITNQASRLDDLISNQQDIDVPRAITELKQEETLLDTALNVGARMISKSLLDYVP